MKPSWPAALLPALLGCGSPEPPPAVAPPRVAVPEPAPVPSPSAIPPPAKAPPPGVIPEDLLAATTDRPFPTTAPLGEAEACARALHKRGSTPTDCVPAAPTILGFHAAEGRVALLDRDAARYIDPCPGVQSVLTTLDGTLVSRATLLPRRSEAQCLNGPQKPWAPSEFAQRLHKAGYVSAVNLVQKVAVAPHGAWVHYPAARLGPPLEGQWIYAHRAPGADRLTVEMVSPDNAARHPLASLALTPKCIVHGHKGGCAEMGAYDHPSIAEAALTPAGDRLILVVHLNSGEGHDTDKLFWTGNVPLPAAVRPAARPPMAP